MNETARFLSVLVYVWQLWRAGQTFSLPRGETPAFRHQLIPLAFVLVIGMSFSAPLQPVLAPAGLIGLAGALILFEWARRSIRGHYFSFVFSHDEPVFLWQGGPFAYIRNPFYTSYLLSAASVVLMFPKISVALPFGLLVAFASRAARHEERKFLASPLRSEYEAYARRTGRFVPWFGRLS